MKRGSLVFVLLVLAACQSAPKAFDEQSTRFPPPVGTLFTLKQDLTIPAGSAHVDLQRGQPVSQGKLDLYRPHCRLDVQEVRETPQVLKPDDFRVKRVYRQTTDLVAQRFTYLRVQQVSENDGGPTFMIYRTVFDLTSTQQPQVRRLTCQQWDRPALGDHLSLKEIRAVLGNYFVVTVTGEERTRGGPEG